MPLNPPASRTLIHTREVVYRGYKRDDAQWDIEATLVDTKTYTFTRVVDVIPPGQPTHDMTIRLTVDDNLVVTAAEASMEAKPFKECEAGQSPFQKMIGARMGGGWRKAVEEAMGGDTGCTHLRELVSNMATIAYQTIPGYKRHLLREAGQLPPTTQPGFHMGRCIGWSFNGPVVARHYPQFVGWKLGKGGAKPPSGD